jgi:hypothetical protein
MRPWQRSCPEVPPRSQDGPGGQSTADPVSTVKSYVAPPSTAVQRARTAYADRHRCPSCSGSDPWAKLAAIDATDPLLARQLDGDR